MIFITYVTGFITCEDFFITCEDFFITCEDFFITYVIEFITCEDFFITYVIGFITYMDFRLFAAFLPAKDAFAAKKTGAGFFPNILLPVMRNKGRGVNNARSEAYKNPVAFTRPAMTGRTPPPRPPVNLAISPIHSTIDVEAMIIPQSDSLRATTLNISPPAVTIIH